ncbi:MAG: GerMN domain-containing protein [Armatimonadetes bacterium]|nr:GerMN domain-containing protein [Armatimonadota bacterium]
MAKAKKKSSAGLLVALCIIAFAAACAGSYYYFTKGRAKVTVRQVKEMPLTSKPAPAGREVTIYLPVITKQGPLLAPTTRRTDAKGGILDAAIDALIAASAEKGAAADLVSPGTRLLSPIKIKGGIATVDFSKEFTDNFSGGVDQEALTLNSIAHTLVHNSGGEVKKVRILVEGNTAETLGGHFELTDPITADSTMLKPGK